MTSIVLIDNNPDRSREINHGLAEHGLTVQSFTQVSEALPAAALPNSCTLVFSTCAADDLAKLASISPTLVLAADATIADAVHHVRQGAIDYLSWPMTHEELNAAIERASVYSVRAPLEILAQFPLIGTSQAMEMLRETISKAGPTDSPVLIIGESGTGKELVARAVHASSNRSGAPLISINCATIPENLIEAELFGVSQLQEAQSTSGLVAAANGGTLFLDEIAELSISAQAKLLQVLLGEHRKLGSATSEPIDIRVIAATHRNLGQLVETKQFREDLFYRLNVINLDLPPLRARQDDAFIIADWLLERTTARLSKTDLTFEANAIDAIRAYHWPGNVRELENAVERAVILCDNGGKISQSHLAIEPASTTDVDIANMPHMPQGELTSLEDYFVKFVQQNQDHLTETELAEKLGISRKSLWERRQRLNIPRRKTKKRGPRQDSASN
ncbi:MAG: two-component system response regulator HydG [Candidatus Azotimanducaceae bacterium]|jgi:two-component system response regulator HydG